jgi:hypothetical protein
METRQSQKLAILKLDLWFREIKFPSLNQLTTLKKRLSCKSSSFEEIECDSIACDLIVCHWVGLGCGVWCGFSCGCGVAEMVLKCGLSAGVGCTDEKKPQ